MEVGVVVLARLGREVGALGSRVGREQPGGVALGVHRPADLLDGELGLAPVGGKGPRARRQGLVPRAQRGLVGRLRARRGDQRLDHEADGLEGELLVLLVPGLLDLLGRGLRRGAGDQALVAVGAQDLLGHDLEFGRGGDRPDLLLVALLRAEDPQDEVGQVARPELDPGVLGQRVGDQELRRGFVVVDAVVARSEDVVEDRELALLVLEVEHRDLALAQARVLPGHVGLLPAPRATAKSEVIP